MSSTCEQCSKPCKSAGGLKLHQKKCKAIASPAAEINIPAIIYAESAFDTMDTDVSYESDSEKGPVISEPTRTLKTMREKYPTCDYIFQLEESGIMGAFYGFEDLSDAYFWFVPHTRNTKVAIHCVKDAKKPMKIMLDIDIAKSGGHMKEHKQIARNASDSLIEEMKTYGQEKVRGEMSRNIRDDKVGYHIDTEVAVDNKAAYGVIIDAIRNRMKPEYREYLDPVPGNNMRMPFTHKKGIQLLPVELDPSKNHTITREKFEFLVPTNTEECVVLEVDIPVQIKPEHDVTDAHVKSAEVIINDYFSKLGHKLNFWWSETRFHVPSGQHCPVCNEVHHSQNNYINISKNGTPWYNCRQKRGEGLPLASKAEIAALFPNSPADDLAQPSLSAPAPPAPTYKAFDASDPYCWVDFEREFGMMKFASWDECIAKTTPCLNRVLAFVSQSTSYFVRKTNTHTNLYDVIPNSAKNFTNMKFTVVDDRKRDCRYSFNEYIGYADPYINKYKSMDFKPNMPHTEELFNMWQGYAAKDLGDEALNADSALAESKLAPLLTFIREIICDSNKETYDYLMQWLSFVLFRPEIAPGILLLLYSQRHGAGKDTFLTFVWKYLIGPHMAKELSCMNELMEKHNGWRARCKMVSITDMGATKEEWRANFTKLNGMITQSRVNINPKGQQQYDIDNIMAYTASTNYLGSMLISESDRRMFVVSVNQSRIGDQAYWDDFNEKVMNQDMGNLFYTYMRKNHGTPLRKLPTPPLTELKKEMIEASLPSPMAFLRDYLAGIRDAHAEASPEAPPLTEHRVASSTLYTEYVRWCADNNERALSCKVFSLNIKEKYPNAWKKLKAGKVFDFAI